MATTMNSWQLVEYGRSNLRLVEVPMPVAGHGEVLVKVHAASLNYRDMGMIEDGMGMPLEGSFTPASDMAGTVAAVGQGVARFKPGDRVISAFFNNWVDGVAPQPIVSLGGPGPGTLSEYVVLNENALVQAPASLTPAQASTLTCAGLTAWFALAEAGSTRVGDTIVVQGTGGVALFAVQLAHAQGAKAIVISGSDEKIEQARALGAWRGINRVRTPDWADSVRELTDGKGADHILELAGGTGFEQSLRAVRQGGRVSVIGILQGDMLHTSVYPLILGRVTVQGIGVGHQRALEDLVRATDRQGIKPVVAAQYPLRQLPEALAHLERGAFGKVVVDVSAGW